MNSVYRYLQLTAIGLAAVAGPGAWGQTNNPPAAAAGATNVTALGTTTVVGHLNQAIATQIMPSLGATVSLKDDVQIQAIAQGANVNYGINWDLITIAPTGVLRLFDRYLIDKQSATLTVGQTDRGEWATLTSNDPDKLFSMRALYRKAAGTATPEDEELLTEFYYRHFQITDEALQRLRENRPEVYQAVG